MQNVWRKLRSFVEDSQIAVNFFDFLIYIGMNPREYGALDYELRTFYLAAYNKKMKALADPT